MPASNNRVLARYHEALNAASRVIVERSNASRCYLMYCDKLDALYKQRDGLHQRIAALRAARAEAATRAPSQDDEDQILAASTVIKNLEREVGELDGIQVDFEESKAAYAVAFSKWTSDPLFRQLLLAEHACLARGLEIPKRTLAEILAA